MTTEPRAGVGPIFTRGGQVLLLRRKNVHGVGSWPTPGGHLESGEQRRLRSGGGGWFARDALPQPLLLLFQRLLDGQCYPAPHVNR